MGKILFANFLEDKRVYHLAYLFWKTFFERLTDATNLEYTTYLNTDNDQDGNPIFHAYLPTRKRALRIVQADPSEAEEEVDIKAWLDEVQPIPDIAPVPELVIDVILSEGTKKVGQRLIRAWVEAEEELTEDNLEVLLQA
ncbi:MAG: hypothetical protein AAFZ63_23460 [Bacteroidota bacterium]